MSRELMGMSIQCFSLKCSGLPVSCVDLLYILVARARFGHFCSDLNVHTELDKCGTE